jgi:hypothetical protein
LERYLVDRRLFLREQTIGLKETSEELFMRKWGTNTALPLLTGFPHKFCWAVMAASS